MEIKASVVIPTYNRVCSLRNCLDALEKQSLCHQLFEVIVVDDGSEDDTLAFLSSFQLQTRLRLKYSSQRRQGPAAARNSGILLSSAEVVAFTDDDCIPEADWLENLLKALPQNAMCAGVGGKIIRLRETLIGRYIDDSGAMNHGMEKGQVRYLVTANALYRRSCLLEINGFDSRITWPGGEDPDLSFRLEERGYELAMTQNAIVRHEHRDTLRGLCKMFFNHGKGRFALVQLGRIKQRNVWGVLLRQYVHSTLRYRNRVDLKIYERFVFCILRWIQYTSIHWGYMCCQNIRSE